MNIVIKDKFKVLDRDTIKYLAIGLMFVGHLVSWLSILDNTDEILPLWKLILEECALFCPAIMFFFIADGYKYTRDKKKYAFRLLVFAVITQFFDWFVFWEQYGWRSFNVIFTLLFGLLAIISWESKLKLWKRITIIIMIDVATVLLLSEWMILGVLFIVTLHVFRERTTSRFVVYMLLALLHNAINVVSLMGKQSESTTVIVFMIGTIAMTAAYLCMTVFYNGKKGKHPVFAKWFFYSFYPAHYLIIYLIFLWMK